LTSGGFRIVSDTLVFTKFGMGKRSQVRTFTPNFTVVALKKWAYGPKNRQK